jgi:hypothetical protein
MKIDQWNPYETREDYFADYGRISKSMLAVYGDSPADFHDIYIARTTKPPPPTDDMIWGNAGHDGLFAGMHAIDKWIVEVPDDLLGKGRNMGRVACIEFCEHARSLGKVPLRIEDVAHLKACIDEAKKALGHWYEHPQLVTEQPITWEHKATGLKCRCMPDMVIDTGANILCIDIKFSDSPMPNKFRRIAQQFEYPLQQVHYSEGVAAKFDKAVDFVFLVIGSNHKRAPKASFQYLSKSSIEGDNRQRGAKAVRETRLAHIVERQTTGDWLEPWEPGPVRRMTEIYVPSYVYKSTSDSEV